VNSVLQKRGVRFAIENNKASMSQTPAGKSGHSNGPTTRRQ
jgi:hypothetical protein